MQTISLERTANQTFSLLLNNDRWDFTVKQAVSSMVADISVNEERILSGQILVAGTPIIPYEHLQSNGNFVIITENDQLPDWERFGVDQFMVYATAEEIASL